MWVLQRGNNGDGCDLASTLCTCDLGKGDLFILSWPRVRRGSLSCCCCLPSETYGRNGATPIFRFFFTELPVPPQAAGVVGTFNVLDIYPEHYGLSFFGPFGCHFFYKVSFFLYTFPFCKYTLHVCYVFNVNLTDSFDDIRSQCRLIE